MISIDRRRLGTITDQSGLDLADQGRQERLAGAFDLAHFPRSEIRLDNWILYIPGIRFEALCEAVWFDHRPSYRRL